MHPMLNIAVRAARSAGNIIVKGFEQHNAVEVEKKANNELVTKIDLATENTIIESIQSSYPNHSFVAEESGPDEALLDLDALKPAASRTPPVKLTPEEMEQRAITDAAGWVLGGLSVSPIDYSYLVYLSYESTDSQLAARIVNTLAEE